MSNEEHPTRTVDTRHTQRTAGVQRAAGTRPAAGSPPILLPLPPVLASRSGGGEPPDQVVRGARWTEGCCVVTLAGDIDFFTASWVRSAVATGASGPATTVVIDASRVGFCDSGLLRAVLPCDAPRRRVRLAAPSPAVRRLLALAAPPDFPPPYPSVAEALRSAGAGSSTGAAPMPSRSG